MDLMMRRVALVFLLITASIWCSALPGQQRTNPDSLGQAAVDLLQAYVRLDTVNPPGNEIVGARFFADIFDEAGIAYEIAESAPGRANIWAKIEGGDEPGLVLLHHMDVVPANEKYWTTEPLGGEIRDGYLYGRGVIDDKASGIAHLLTFLELHRRGQPLNRDLIFMATADEEAGGLFGVGWLVQNRPELFENVGVVINEGGVGTSATREGVERLLFNVEVTQKVPLWLKLVAEDVPGHGSMPRSTSSVTRLVRALGNILDHPFPPQIGPAVDAYFKAIAPGFDEPLRTMLGNMEQAVRDEEFLSNLHQQNPMWHALTRNTCSLTMLEGSNKINVVPPVASAQLDCRLLPEQDPDEFLDQLTAIIDDDAISIERIMGFTPAISSADTRLYRVIESLTAEYYPEATIAPSVVAGFTDSHFFRDMDIIAYGYHPVVLPIEELARIHGNDERLSLENIQSGTRMILNVVSEMVYGD
jgi:acetylornithine deacetylase/succinyl-diaminopimelate desuccinylase-like protein